MGKKKKKNKDKDRDSTSKPKKEKKKRSSSPSSASSASSSDRSDRSRSPKRGSSTAGGRGEAKSSASSREPEKAKKTMKEDKTTTMKKTPKTAVLIAGYSDEANPFNDQNLSKPFVWKKKLEKEVEMGRDPASITREALKKRQEETVAEIEKVKERRKQREREKLDMELLREQMTREAALANELGWEEKEEKFHQEQAMIRSEIRIREGREKPIDLLAKNISLLQQSDEEDESTSRLQDEVEITEPHLVFRGLDTKELQALKEDINTFIQLGANIEYWKAALFVCDVELEKSLVGGKSQGYHGGLSDAVRDEVMEELSHKSLSELDIMEKSAQKIIDSANDPEGPAVDVEYWEAILKEIVFFKNRSVLQQTHEELLRRRLARLKQQHIRELNMVVKKEVKFVRGGEEAAKFAKLVPSAASKYDFSLSFEPPLVTSSSPLYRELQALAIEVEEDRENREAQRRQVMQDRGMSVEALNMDATMQNLGPEEVTLAKRFSDEEKLMRNAAEDLDVDEEVFTEEVKAAETSTYWWHDKYRPRKPRFFNRVKTGFDWNKYNQAHYDKENPPPKIVQGYKFVLFYPDLIDPYKAPTYKIERIPDNPDYCIIRFVAGAPYEDLAFKIVRKDWEMSHKQGFRCVFDRGVLQLFFNFKRTFYRR